MADPTVVHRELRRRIVERLDHWLRDSFNLYNAAGMPPQQAPIDALTALFACLVNGLQVLHADPQEAARILSECLAHLEVEVEVPPPGATKH